MGLSKEEKEQLAALQRKAEEPDGPPPNVNFTLDLSSDAAWERGKKLGLFRDDPPESDGDGDGDGDGGGDDPPKRSGGGARRWAGT